MGYPLLVQIISRRFFFFVSNKSGANRLRTLPTKLDGRSDGLFERRVGLS